MGRRGTEKKNLVKTLCVLFFQHLFKAVFFCFKYTFLKKNK